MFVSLLVVVFALSFIGVAVGMLIGYASVYSERNWRERLLNFVMTQLSLWTAAGSGYLLFF